MTYEYLCSACGAAWEAEQSISEQPLKECPTCHKDTAKRQVSGGAGFILKGGGWYADLYGSSKPKAPESTSTKTEAKTESKAESKSSSDSSSSTKSDGSSGSSSSTKPATSTV